MTDQLIRRKAPLRGAFLLFGLLTLQACADSSSHNTVIVEHVIDGDTVVMEGGGKLRLLGINAPEKKFDHRPAQPYALEALLLLRQLTEGRTVRLIKGLTGKDKYGRSLGYLELLDGTDVQQMLLEQGYGFAVAFPPDIDRLDRYQLAEAKARQQQLGVWRSKDWSPQNVDNGIDLSGGFGLFQGRIKSVRKSRKNVLFAMGSGLTLTVRHQAWNEFWKTSPETLRGKRVIARGWVSEGRNSYKDQYFLRIRHPFMMQTDS